MISRFIAHCRSVGRVTLFDYWVFIAIGSTSVGYWTLALGHLGRALAMFMLGLGELAVARHRPDWVSGAAGGR